MPVYEYYCSACGHRIDILHGLNESGPNFCPACGAERTMRKAFAPPAIVFKGSGWAKKERHAASGSKKSAAPDSEPAAQTTSGDPKSTESSGSEKAKPAPSTGAG